MGLRLGCGLRRDDTPNPSNLTVDMCKKVGRTRQLVPGHGDEPPCVGLNKKLDFAAVGVRALRVHGGMTVGNSPDDPQASAARRYFGVGITSFDKQLCPQKDFARFGVSHLVQIKRSYPGEVQQLNTRPGIPSLLQDGLNFPGCRRQRDRASSPLRPALRSSAPCRMPCRHIPTQLLLTKYRGTIGALQESAGKQCLYIQWLNVNNQDDAGTTKTTEWLLPPEPKSLRDFIKLQRTRFGGSFCFGRLGNVWLLFPMC